jgi:hypothetical protein
MSKPGEPPTTTRENARSWAPSSNDSRMACKRSMGSPTMPPSTSLMASMSWSDP